MFQVSLVIITFGKTILETSFYLGIMGIACRMFSGVWEIYIFSSTIKKCCHAVVDKCFCINRVIIDEINDLLSFNYSVNHFHFIDQSNRWTVSNSTLDFSLFCSDSLHLVEISYFELGKSILKAIVFTITSSEISNHHKSASCSTCFNLNLEDFLTFSCIVPVRNFVYSNKSIFKVVSTSFTCQNKPICHSNVPTSKHVAASSFCTDKPISNRNVNPSKFVSASSVSPGKLICGSNVSLTELGSTIIFHPSKPNMGSNIR